MGYRSDVPSVNCVECRADVDERYRDSHKHGHKCRPADIDWDEVPDASWSSEFIAWSGTCEVCGRRVYECYVPDGALYDAVTNQRV